MIRVLFVCHGNICRSAMAEAMCREMLRERGIRMLWWIRRDVAGRDRQSDVSAGAGEAARKGCADR